MRKIFAVIVGEDNLVHFTQTDNKEVYKTLCQEGDCSGEQSAPAKSVPLVDVLKDSRSKLTKYRICPLCSIMVALKLQDTATKMEGIEKEVEHLAKMITHCLI